MKSKKKRNVSILKKYLLCPVLTAGLLLSSGSTVFASEDAQAEAAPVPDESLGDTETAPVEITHTAYYDQPAQSNQWDSWPQAQPIEAHAAIVMDYNTGAVLYAKNPDEQLYPASITKIMTTLLACEHCNMEDVVTASENAVYGISEDSSKAYLEVGEQLTMTQMLMSVMLQSANDAAYAVAEHTSGSMKKFVELMNVRVQEIGCTNTHFNNPHGLHGTNHYTSARDMALITKTAWRNARFRSFAGTVTYEIPPTNKFKETRYYLNNHKMMETEAYEYDGVLGGKTGYTDEAGNTLVTVAKRGPLAVIVVVLGGVNGAYDDTAALLNYTFENFEVQKINRLTEAQTPLLSAWKAFASLQDKAASILEPAGSYYVTLPKGFQASSLRKENVLVPSVNGKARIQTRFYYGDQQMGICNSYLRDDYLTFS